MQAIMAEEASPLTDAVGPRLEEHDPGSMSITNPDHPTLAPDEVLAAESLQSLKTSVVETTMPVNEPIRSIMSIESMLSSPLSECHPTPDTSVTISPLRISTPDPALYEPLSPPDSVGGSRSPATPIDDDVEMLDPAEEKGMPNRAAQTELARLLSDGMARPMCSTRQSKKPERLGYEDAPTGQVKRKVEAVVTDKAAVTRNTRQKTLQAASETKPKRATRATENKHIQEEGLPSVVPGATSDGSHLQMIPAGQNESQNTESTPNNLIITPSTSSTPGLQTLFLNSQANLNADGTFHYNTQFDLIADKDFRDLVAAAKKEGRIRKVYNTSALRVLQNQILVRTPCSHCETHGRWSCNRAVPCNICIKDETREECMTDRPFELAKAPSAKNITIKEESIPDIGTVTSNLRSRRRVTGSVQPLRQSTRPLGTVSASTTPVPVAIRRGSKASNHPLLICKPLPALRETPESVIECAGKPILWAESRTELCETLPWYRGFQSGAYHTDGHARGLLLDKCAGVRDFVGSRVIIARAGGDRTVDSNGDVSNGGSMTNIASSTIEAFRRSMVDCQPIGLIIGQNNPKAPAKLTYLYSGLSWFLLVAIWAEKEGNAVWTKYRFEKMNDSTESWWVPAGFDTDTITNVAHADVRAPRQVCHSCLAQSPQMYEEGWTCLQRACPAFWTHDRRPIVNQDLHYLESYLKESNRPRFSASPAFPFKPQILKFPSGIIGISTSRACWKGICCPDCGRCNSRLEWRGWKCKGCGFEHSVPQITYSAHLISGGDQPLATGHAFPSGSFLAPVMATDSLHGRYRRQDVQIPGAGRIVIFRSNAVVNAEGYSPDQMFEDLQAPHHPLRRLEIENGKVSKLITRHFAMNHGMVYKYVAAVNTNAMCAAPLSCRHAMARLTWAKNIVENAGTATPAANELLTLAYMEDQSIGYHDDGETGLGPVIATLSLGVKATMKLRLKAKYYSLDTFKANDEEPVPGCIEYMKRHEAWTLIQQTPEHDRAALADELWKRMQMSKLDTRKQIQRNVPIEFPLRHGDVVVMQGARLQKVFEHAVIPDKGLRFAITARYIDPESVAGTDEWKHMITNVDDASEYVYRHEKDWTFSQD